MRPSLQYLGHRTGLLLCQTRSVHKKGASEAEGADLLQLKLYYMPLSLLPPQPPLLVRGHSGRPCIIAVSLFLRGFSFSENMILHLPLPMSPPSALGPLVGLSSLSSAHGLYFLRPSRLALGFRKVIRSHFLVRLAHLP